MLALFSTTYYDDTHGGKNIRHAGQRCYLSLADLFGVFFQMRYPIESDMLPHARKRRSGMYGQDCAYRPLREDNAASAIAGLLPHQGEITF